MTDEHSNGDIGRRRNFFLTEIDGTRQQMDETIAAGDAEELHRLIVRLQELARELDSLRSAASSTDE